MLRPLFIAFAALAFSGLGCADKSATPSFPPSSRSATPTPSSSGSSPAPSPDAAATTPPPLVGGSTWSFRDYRAGREAPQSKLIAYTLQRSGARAMLTVDTQECLAVGGKCTGPWVAGSHEVFEGKAVDGGEVVGFEFSKSDLGVLHCRPKSVTVARPDAVRVRIFPSEGTYFGRWEPRAATQIDALSCDDKRIELKDAFVFAALPGLEHVSADDGCPEDAKPAQRAQCDPSPPKLRMIAPGGAIAPAVRAGK